MAVTSEVLTFVETTVFTKRITALGLEESSSGLTADQKKQLRAVVGQIKRSNEKETKA